MLTSSAVCRLSNSERHQLSSTSPRPCCTPHGYYRVRPDKARASEQQRRTGLYQSCFPSLPLLSLHSIFFSPRHTENITTMHITRSSILLPIALFLSWWPALAKGESGICFNNHNCDGEGTQVQSGPLPTNCLSFEGAVRAVVCTGKDCKTGCVSLFATGDCVPSGPYACLK